MLWQAALAYFDKEIYNLYNWFTLVLHIKEVKVYTTAQQTCDIWVFVQTRGWPDNLKVYPGFETWSILPYFETLLLGSNLYEGA